MTLLTFLLCMIGAVLLGMGLGAAPYARAALVIFRVLRDARGSATEATMTDALLRSSVWRWPRVIDEIRWRRK